MAFGVVKSCVESNSISGIIQAAAPGSRLSGAAVGFEAGNTYRAVVTGRAGEMTELVIGNRYLLARSTFNFNFNPGQSVSLLLVEARADSLIFRLVGSEVAETSVLPSSIRTQLENLGIRTTELNVIAARSLSQAGATLNAGNVGLFARLAAEFGDARIPVLAMIYAKLAASGANPAYSTLAAVASYIGSPPALAKSLDELRRLRERRGERRFDDALGALAISRGAHSPDDVKAVIEFLFSPPERDIAKAVYDYDESEESAEGGLSDARVGGFSALAAGLRAGPLFSSMKPAEEVEIEALRRLESQIEAVNILNAVPGESTLAEIPLEIGGSAASAVLEYQGGPGAAYDEDEAAVFMLETPLLGKVEAHFVKRAGSLRVRVLAESERTLDAFEHISSRDGFGEEISKASGMKQVEATIEKLVTKPALITEST